MRSRRRIAVALAAAGLVGVWPPPAAALAAESIDSPLVAAGTARVVDDSGAVKAASVLSFEEGSAVRVRVGLCPEIGVSCTVVDQTLEDATLTETYPGHLRLSADLEGLGPIELDFHWQGVGMTTQCADSEAQTSYVAAASTTHDAYLQGDIGDWEIRSPVCGVHAADAHLQWVGP